MKVLREREQIMERVRKKLLDIIVSSTPADLLSREKNEKYVFEDGEFSYKVYCEYLHEPSSDFGEGYSYFESAWDFCRNGERLWRWKDKDPYELIIKKISPILEEIKKDKEKAKQRVQQEKTKEEIYSITKYLSSEKEK